MYKLLLFHFSSCYTTAPKYYRYKDTACLLGLSLQIMLLIYINH